MNDHRSHGLTLIEVVVAMAVFAVVAVMAYGGLNTVLRHADHQRQAALRLHQLQVAMRILQADLEQALGPAVDVPSDQPVRPSLTATATPWRLDLQRFIDFPAPGMVPPRRLRVVYRLDQGRLVRQLQPYAGPTGTSSTRQRVMLDAVEEARLRFADRQGRWHPVWPPRSGQAARSHALPLAVELELVLPQWGIIRRIYRLPGL